MVSASTVESIPPAMNIEAAGCPVCGSNRIGPLAVRGGYRFDECGVCGFAFLNPRPAQAQLNDLYRAERRAPEPTFDKAASRMRRAWLKLPRLLRYALRKDALDLGCGGGFMTHVLGTVARSATGVDINANAIDYARSRFKRPRFLCRDLHELLDLPDRFDFIYSSEVIEHVGDVNLYMQVLRTLSRPGAHVYLTTPNRGHPRVPADITRWDVFCPPVHAQFFTRHCAGILFRRYGFEITRFYENPKPGLLLLARRQIG